MSQKRVLIAEDEKPLAHALELKLQKEGYDVVVARNGQDCIDQLTSSTFDVLLLDMMMPVLDGFQVLEKIQGMEHKPVTYVLSNLSLPEDESKAKAMGAKDFFVKSNTPLSAIVDIVRQV